MSRSRNTQYFCMEMEQISFGNDKPCFTIVAVSLSTSPDRVFTLGRPRLRLAPASEPSYNQAEIITIYLVPGSTHNYLQTQRHATAPGAPLLAILHATFTDLALVFSKSMALLSISCNIGLFHTRLPFCTSFNTHLYECSEIARWRPVLCDYSRVVKFPCVCRFPIHGAHIDAHMLIVRGFCLW